MHRALINTRNGARRSTFRILRPLGEGKLGLISLNVRPLRLPAPPLGGACSGRDDRLTHLAADIRIGSHQCVGADGPASQSRPRTPASRDARWRAATSSVSTGTAEPVE